MLFVALPVYLALATLGTVTSSRRGRRAHSEALFVVNAQLTIDASVKNCIGGYKCSHRAGGSLTYVCITGHHTRLHWLTCEL